jgi:hypothetical protein
MSTCSNETRTLDALFAIPQGLETLLQQVKQIIPIAQTIIKTIFFML